jgi:hypothetical protein
MVAFLSACLTAKDHLLYRGHDGCELLGITALKDERPGGAILWLPGSAILYG